MSSRANRLLLLLVVANAGAWLTHVAAQPDDTPPTQATAPADAASGQLDPIVVQHTRYVDPFTAKPQRGFRLTLQGELPVFSYEASPFIVTAARTPQVPTNVAQTTRVFLAETLRAAPTSSVDATLRSVPAFGLFRRSDSLSANPTAQGVSLRGLGPSGASRSLVLHDGVPLNDPFGGWIAWAKIPRDGLARAEVIPAGGATAWGNASLGGVVQLFTRKAEGESLVVRVPAPPGAVSNPEGQLAWGTRATLFARAELGDFGTRSLEFSTAYPLEHGTLQVLARTFSTDGFKLVAPEHRGPIDIAAWSRHRWLAARWRQAIGSDAELIATVRGFEEKRGNGTPYQQNGSREQFASLAIAGQVANDFLWNAVACVQSQSFASTFSAVNATRSDETPASDQFAVPATSFGANWSGTWKHGRSKVSNDAPRTITGVDLRFVRGETREHFLYTAGDFTRERVAGGRQLIGGAYVLHERPLSAQLRGSIGARGDAWRDTDGHRRELDTTTGELLRNDTYADRDGVQFSPSAGLVWTPARAWRVRASAQQAFRRPTLNEFYRPFRVGPNITEANADLETEHVTSAELGAEWTLPLGAPGPAAKASHSDSPSSTGRSGHKAPPTVTLGATAFWNDFRDAAGNVTIASGPGAHPLFGFIPAGGVGRQRLNLERTRVQGVELSARWRLSNALTLTGDYLFNDATVRRAAIAPALIGKRLAQVPRHSAALGATWNAPHRLTFTPRLRWIGRQFEDDENQLVLGEVVVVDLGVSHRLDNHLELFVTIENLSDARIETGRTAGGLVNVGMPRFALFGVRGTW